MRWLIPLAIMTAVPDAANAQDAAAGGPEAEVIAAVHAFHAALAAGDSLAAIGVLHPEVVIYESGRSENLTQYRSGHLRSDIAFASATQRALTDESVQVWGDQALYTAQSHTTGTVRERAIDSRGVETMVLIRSADGWRIRHIHWSSR